MKLIGSLTSPYVRKARIVLAEKRIEYQFEVDSPWIPDNRVAQVNPLGKIPVLVLDDGRVLFDSRVIVEYLDNLVPDNTLIPKLDRERFEVKRWEAVADGICDAAALIFLEKKRPLAQQGNDWIARQEDKINRGLDFVADALGDNAWCVGGNLSLADLAVGCALGYLLFRFPQIEWQQKHAKLACLYTKLMSRSAFIETIPQG
ncbi:MAG: glutathione S-transferase [Candidatus Accumulibacter sp.]|nr:glutathione S-transferase [Accumulibacter sp.]